MSDVCRSDRRTRPWQLQAWQPLKIADAQIVVSLHSEL